MAFVCEKCGKEFTEKTNLTRQQKSHGGREFPCQECDKVFTGADASKRHQKAHEAQQFFKCPECISSFTRTSDLMRYIRTTHCSTSRDKSRSPLKRPEAPSPTAPRESTKRCEVSPIPGPSTKNPRIDSVPDVLPEDPEIRSLYLNHCASICTEETTGNRVQNRYNFTLIYIDPSTFPEMVRQIFGEQTTAFKINLSFCFILSHVETGVLRYYHSSQNNARF